MKTKLKLAHPEIKTIKDLCQVTGLSQPSVVNGIVRGELPGHKVGSRYVIPSEAFERFCKGDWRPEPRPQVFTPVKIGLVRKAS